MIGPLEAHEESAAIALWQAAGLTRPWNDPLSDIAVSRACPSSEILAARGEDGSLVGTVMTGFDGHRGWFYYLAVDEAERGKGIGRALVHAAEAWLAERGCPVSRLMIRADNEAVLQFYTALGYELSDIRVLGRRLRQPDQGGLT